MSIQKKKQQEISLISHIPNSLWPLFCGILLCQVHISFCGAGLKSNQKYFRLSLSIPESHCTTAYILAPGRMLLYHCLELGKTMIFLSEQPVWYLLALECYNQRGSFQLKVRLISLCLVSKLCTILSSRGLPHDSGRKSVNLVPLLTWLNSARPKSADRPPAVYYGLLSIIWVRREHFHIYTYLILWKGSICMFTKLYKTVIKGKRKPIHSLLLPRQKQDSCLITYSRQWSIVLKQSCGEIYYEHFCCRKYIRKLFIIEQQFSPEEDRKKNTAKKK